MNEKSDFNHAEEARRGSRFSSSGRFDDEAVAKHGDRALAYLGDERIILTDEDVSCE